MATPAEGSDENRNRRPWYDWLPDVYNEYSHIPVCCPCLARAIILTIPQDSTLRREEVLDRLDNNPDFGYKIVLVAGAGFMIDAYDVSNAQTNGSMLN